MENNRIKSKSAAFLMAGFCMIATKKVRYELRYADRCKKAIAAVISHRRARVYTRERRNYGIDFLTEKY